MALMREGLTQAVVRQAHHERDRGVFPLILSLSKDWTAGIAVFRNCF